MNAIKSTFLLLFVAIFTLTSCDNEPLTGTFEDESGIPSDSNDNTDGNADDNSGIDTTPFFANVDGEEFPYITLQSYILNGKLWVRGADELPNKITLGFPTDIAAGTFEITPDSDTYEGIYSDASNNVLARANTGTITIIAHDIDAKTISGTFTFIASPSGSTTPQYTISEGKFNVSY
jgi:hypothetical protein